MASLNLENLHTKFGVALSNKAEPLFLASSKSLLFVLVGQLLYTYVYIYIYNFSYRKYS